MLDRRHLMAAMAGLSLVPVMGSSAGAATGKEIDAEVDLALERLYGESRAAKALGEKAVGILVEASTTGAGAMTLVAGIGINVLQTAFDPEIEGIATSIAAHGPRPERAQVLLAVLERLSVRLEQFERDGLSGMLGELRARDATLGRRVRCASGEGLGAGIFDDGALRVQTAAGEMIRVQAGEVEILRA